MAIYDVFKSSLKAARIEELLIQLDQGTYKPKESSSSGKSIKRWLRFDPNNRKGLIIKSGTNITLSNGTVKYFSGDTKIDLTDYITEPGKDYFVYINDDESIIASSSKQLIGTQIGRFHTLCVNVGDITMIAPASPSSGLSAGNKYLVKAYKKDDDPDFYEFYNKNITAVTVQTYYDVVTCEHPLSGFIAGDILPESVFCLDWQPDCLYEDGMVYDKDIDKCVDIYLQSGTAHNTRSIYGAVHTNSRQSINCWADLRMVGKEPLDDFEFTSAALGSNEKTNIIGSKDQTTVGGHVDTANRRMISAIGCEEMCGYLWQWLKETGGTGNVGNWSATDGHGSFGQEHARPFGLAAGGQFTDPAPGSRCRYSDCACSNASVTMGCRGSSRIKK